MSKVEDFLTKEEEQEIVAAICTAEKNTSGEIRVHLEKTTALDPYDRALEVFNQLKMDQTQLQNGVLIYVAVKDRNFVICGDKGINDVVKEDFWNSTRDVIVAHFKNGNFKQGLIDGIIKAGEQLQQYFPHLEGDKDELSNEISKG
ncbi:TPM domain-containing protein [Flavobacterium sp. I-SCBP12n]|uniref:TPM domain-containing protein n=2 Tax=Flavobacterium TaxID=237 RepID=A0A9X2BLI9_9FLAO|nr:MULTISPECIES: TPM domain-containing protein [Flavobacterium]MBP4140575.1 TPM domain-containing protein [Flavobacterium flabelliforme]MCK8141982.1 TPM domain-containing protein [Flavobacterium pygoscelis]